MKKAIPTMATLPRNGCARCIWWRNRNKSPWGRCGVWREERWYQAPPCPEYELNGDTPDEIPLYLGETCGTLQ